MNVKKTIKKIVALGAGATMVGATIMGATAQLEGYPGDWITDGQFDGKIIVGLDAATSDVLGAIDIAASLQAASTVQTKVEVPGAAGKTILTGDVVEIGEANDLLSLNEPIGDVRETITEFELGALKGGVISTDEGTTAYKQYLRFKVANASELFPTAVVYGENDAPNEEVGDWLFIAEGNEVTQDAFFEWEIEFEEGLEAEIEVVTAGSLWELEDLEDEVFNIFGTDFVFVDSEMRNNCTTPDLKLEFLAGDVTDVLQEGETKTYTIDGKDYEVTLVFVSNPNTGTGVEAKLSVNGELTDAMGDGGTDILSDGLEIGIQEILVSERGGIVEFFLGATKVQFRDLDTSDSDGATNNGFSSDVEVTEETIEEGWVRILGQCIGSASGAFTAGDEFEITNIQYRLTADAIVGTTNVFVPEGHGVREFLDEPEGLLSPNFDVRYEGFLEVGETPIEIYARGDDEYRLRMTNRQGNTYDIPYVEVTRAGTFRFGEDDTESLIFVEDGNFDTLRTNANASLNLTAADFYLSQDDKFVVWNARNDLWDDQAFSHVLEYESVDSTEKVLTFEDLAVGTKEFTYQTDSETDPLILGEGDLIVGGNAYQIWVSSATGNPIAVDLNADGDVAGDKAKFTTKGGGVIDLDNASTTPERAIEGSNVLFTVHTEGSQFDETDEGGEELIVNITEASDNQVQMRFHSYNRVTGTAGSGSWPIDRTTTVFIEGVGQVATSLARYSAFQFDPQEPDDLDDHELEATDYGIMYDLFDPSGNEPEELTLLYPNSERGVQVFVTAGSVTATEGGIGGITTTVVNPIAVGLAVLDVDAPALGTENMIVLGGSCINRLSAQLLGATYPACGEEAAALGFEEGKAVIKLYEDQNAILVAGYTATDTLGASYVLADYEDYDLMGMEVEVVVVDLDTITVNPVI
ncbi:S-layer protein [Nanoarchaeota archaeon]